MESFLDLKARTLCPFAKSAKIVTAPLWREDLTYQRNVQRHANALRSFARVGQAQSLHGFVAEIPARPAYADLPAIRDDFGRYLRGLGLEDESCAVCLAQDKLNKGWQFTFEHVRMFLNVFASCYATGHSKFIDSTSFFIFFQPEYSFRLCGKRPLTDVVKQEIRARFRAAGMPYNGALIDREIEALIYLFPESEAAEPIAWWD